MLKKYQNWLRRFKNTKGWNLTVRALSIRKIQFEEENVQNQMFMDSIKCYLKFNWIYGGFDCKKNWFLSQFRLLSEAIKVLGSNYNFGELIWSNQGLHYIINKVWWPIKDLIETNWNQETKPEKALKSRDPMTIYTGVWLQNCKNIRGLNRKYSFEYWIRRRCLFLDGTSISLLMKLKIIVLCKTIIPS
jgi:hypothetical protein